MLDLHRRMFGDVWMWAGTIRKRITNIGIEPSQIDRDAVALAGRRRSLLASRIGIHGRRARRTIHGRLVGIHPFPNGNGRGTRLMADLYLTYFDLKKSI